MMAHPINREYVNWNLERVAELLHSRFTGSAVFVIKPTRMHLRTFSVYSNFLDCNAFGAPTHESNGGSWNHLHKLYESALKYSTEKEKCINGAGSQDQSIATDLNNVAVTKQDGDKSIDFSGSCKMNMPRITIIGFSKGCIVLNQLLYDLEEIDVNEVLKKWVQQISAFYWLDGGHPGGSNTWVTDSTILERFSNLKLQIFVHVTPYQVRDEMRKWIGKEEQKFVEKLKKLDAQVEETLHFENEPRSIDNHFKVLQQF